MTTTSKIEKKRSWRELRGNAYRTESTIAQKFTHPQTGAWSERPAIIPGAVFIAIHVPGGLVSEFGRYGCRWAGGMSCSQQAAIACGGINGVVTENAVTLPAFLSL